MTRLRFGAPPAANCRERCSRESPSRAATAAGRDRLVRPVHQQFPDLALERVREPEEPWSVRQGAPPRRRERHPAHQFTDDGIVHALDRHRGDPFPPAGRQRLAVVRAERGVGHDRDVGEVGAEGGPFLDHPRARREDDRLHDAPGEQLSEDGGSAAGDDAGAATGKGAPERGDGRPALEQRGDGRHGQPCEETGSGCFRGRPAPTATSVRAISPARRSTPRALS